MVRRLFLSLLLGLAPAPALGQTASPPPAPLVIYAGMAGQLTQDRDALGGNPFASALVEALAPDRLTLELFVSRLASANARYSGGWHRIDMPRRLPAPGARLDGAGGRRMALVLINSDYSQTPNIYSLPGAVFDAQRVPAALRAAGYETTLLLDAGAETARAELDAFARRSAEADVALIYVGGHGVQQGRTVFWVQGDYPDPSSRRHLSTHALSLDRIGEAARARTLNLVLYSSCRDDPFSHD